MNKAKIPAPKTIIVSKENKDTLEKELGLPIVLKQPDSSFSQGVIKANNTEELKANVDMLLSDSDLIIAQEFRYSDFDWRIGILDKEPIFACKYFMAKDHWQIYNWKGKQDDKYGNFEAVPIYNVPKNIMKMALKAANLIGDGLYGVDLKQIGNEAFVIELNDNPSIENGVEDQIMKEHLYHTIMRSFKERIEKLRFSKEINL